MKRILSLMLVAICCIGIATAQEAPQTTQQAETPTSKYMAAQGYRGLVELAPLTLSTSGATLKFNTIHGYQFNHSLFLGGGIGIFARYNSDVTDIPVYVAIQSNVGEKLAQFTYGARLGMSAYSKHYYVDAFGKDQCYEHFGALYLQFNLGLRLGFTPRHALTIKPELEVVYWGLPTIQLGLGFGFEF